MTKLLISALLAGLALATPTAPNSVRINEVVEKPDPLADLRDAQDTRISAVANTFLDKTGTIFGLTQYLYLDECYYLPNLAAEVTWTKDAGVNLNYQVIFWTGRDCDGDLLVPHSSEKYDISHYYSVSIDAADYSEPPTPPGNRTATTAQQGRRPDTVVDRRPLEARRRTRTGE
ncbi:hypothetical protein EJ05DRAFT_47332 [Pseudovirgaria hyperparasitica]|uniref:Uncharacterized protein n=1 Tax=Pseudovirgaria hyperparasitica TaxID=470096 RepID=A0A6A6W2T6_9PEZI|nr:uncharacterized protein EJ05DRAFT_47332 [Pseudovirgaria hyperparasitica]KAF2756903.1 hypothetical protein EJ05DRAFT_47332 [Pseudovirgaria hyperparasitica]